MQTIKKFLNKIKSAYKISSLGANLLEKLFLFFAFFWVPIKKKMGLGDKIEIKLKLKIFNKTFFFYLTDSSDLAILKEIFIDNEYDFNLPYSPKIIFDLGSNVGLSVIYFKLKYPDAKIYCFEPDPITFNKLNKNVKQFKDIYCFNLAISNKIGKSKFYVYPGSSMSSSLMQRIPNQSSVEVNSQTLDEFMKQENIFKIDLIKFDVEGAEMEIFKNFKNLSAVSNLIGEVHLDLINTTLKNFLILFSNYKKEVKEISRNRRYSIFLYK